MIQMYNVCKTYPNGVSALKDIDLHINKGEFVFLVGPSGAGKTTLMQLIFRDELPTEGNVIIDGRNINRLSISKVPYLRRSIGIVLQQFNLVPRKTVFENVAFALWVTGTGEKEIRTSTERALKDVGLYSKRDLTPFELSGGEQQRACIARAIVNNPAILLTDEPTGNLDPELSIEIMGLFERINNRGTTVLMATHDSTLVNKMSKRVIRLVDGQIVSDCEEGTYSHG
jgi:cell division transport system ATP-binding protein